MPGLQSGRCRFESRPGLLRTKVYSAFHPSGVGKSVPAAAGKAKAGMAHSDCGWKCGCAGKIVKSLENTCHTLALLRWWFAMKRRYIKCMYLYLYLYLSGCWLTVEILVTGVAVLGLTLPLAELLHSTDYPSLWLRQVLYRLLCDMPVVCRPRFTPLNCITTTAAAAADVATTATTTTIFRRSRHGRLSRRIPRDCWRGIIYRPDTLPITQPTVSNYGTTRPKLQKYVNSCF